MNEEAQNKLYGLEDSEGFYYWVSAFDEVEAKSFVDEENAGVYDYDVQVLSIEELDATTTVINDEAGEPAYMAIHCLGTKGILMCSEW